MINGAHNKPYAGLAFRCRSSIFSVSPAKNNVRKLLKIVDTHEIV